MGIPLDFITRRKELATQTASGPNSVMETPQTETPSSGQTIFFNKPGTKPTSLTPVASSEVNPVTNGDTTESMIDELSGVFDGVDLSSLKKAP